MTPRWYLSSFISLEGVQATLLRDGDPLAENTYSSVVKIPVPGAIAATGFGNIVVDLPGLTLKAWQVAARPAAGPPGGMKKEYVARWLFQRRQGICPHLKSRRGQGDICSTDVQCGGSQDVTQAHGASTPKKENSRCHTRETLRSSQAGDLLIFGSSGNGRAIWSSHD